MMHNGILRNLRGVRYTVSVYLDGHFGYKRRKKGKRRKRKEREDKPFFVQEGREEKEGQFSLQIFQTQERLIPQQKIFIQSLQISSLSYGNANKGFLIPSNLSSLFLHLLPSKHTLMVTMRNLISLRMLEMIEANRHIMSGRQLVQTRHVRFVLGWVIVSARAKSTLDRGDVHHQMTQANRNIMSNDGAARRSAH